MATIDISPEDLEQQGFGKIWNRAAITSKVLTVLFAIAAAVIFASLVVGNPMVLFANATASVVGQPAPQPLTGDEIALFHKAAYQTEHELSRPEVEALTTQFQAWAAEADAKAQVQPPGQAATDHLRTAFGTKTQSTSQVLM
jgi:hypothetical protein